ncbi:hypothetical protein LEP1GSC165_3619 [Leptospira santarosai str. CBC523]|nr:hypothetical protein LEP1GSC165_3619 [Leptospira santarosai str. CBC523]
MGTHTFQSYRMIELIFFEFCDRSLKEKIHFIEIFLSIFYQS